MSEVASEATPSSTCCGLPSIFINLKSGKSVGSYASCSKTRQALLPALNAKSGCAGQRGEAAAGAEAARGAQGGRPRRAHPPALVPPRARRGTRRAAGIRLLRRLLVRSSLRHVSACMF